MCIRDRSTINAKIDVFFCKSTDRGETFTNPIVVTDDESKYNQDFPVMTVDDNGGIHIAAIDNRNLEQGKVNFAELMYTHSTDEGESWSKNKIISKINSDAGACECCWPAIDTFTDNNGKVTVSILYRSNINNLRVSYLANSFDGGQNFETPIRIGFKDWIINSCPVSGPSIFYDNNGILHTTYKTISDIYYSYYDVKNNSERNEVYIAGGSNPFVTYNHTNDQIYITYEKYESDKLQTRIVSSTDKVSFSPSKLLLNNDLNLSMFNCKLIENKNRMNVIWEDDSEGIEKNSIWFAEYNSTQSNIETNYEKPTFEYLSNGDLLVNTKERNSIITISDLMGRVIYKQEAILPTNDLRINLNNYASRIFICNVRNRNYNTSQLIIK